MSAGMFLCFAEQHGLEMEVLGALLVLVLLGVLRVRLSDLRTVREPGLGERAAEVVSTKPARAA
jgi:hypothetical protein